MASDYEQIRRRFNSLSVCLYGEAPKLDYEPGCHFIECSKGEACKCRMNDGDGGPVTEFLIRWKQQYQK